jgi:PKD repeat protein
MNYYAQCREVTIECSNTYMPNATLMPMYWNYNHNSMLSYMEQCLNGIHGTITDAETGEPIEATVSIVGHDHHGSEVSSHLPAGDYHRPIKGGTYNVTYSAYGYEPQTVTISINDGEAVVQDVQLTPIPDTPLKVGFNAEKELVTVGSTVKFTNLSQGLRIVGWEWQFEGGTPSTSTERNPSVVYETPGCFDVTLSVTDANGQTSSFTKEDFIDVYHAIPIQDGEVVVSDCRGLFLPSGGDCGHYGNNESYKMTVRPDGENRKICANFLHFRTQPDTDVLKVYDGSSTDAPLIGSYSGQQIPDTIIATNSEGVLTFSFTSNAYINFLGWVATLTCVSNVSTEESSSIPTKVYPNPTKGSFTLETEEETDYALYNCFGQHILSGHCNGRSPINAETLSNGIYFLHLNGKSGSKVEKLVIEK